MSSLGSLVTDGVPVPDQQENTGMVQADTPALLSWIEKCQKMLTEKRGGSLEIAMGSKNVKIIINDHSRSVFAFIDRATGDVLKPATWNAPAKHARGNIYDASNGMARMTEYGPAYLR
jgi:hypothetical protein